MIITQIYKDKKLWKYKHGSIIGYDEWVDIFSYYKSYEEYVENVGVYHSLTLEEKLKDIDAKVVLYPSVDLTLVIVNTPLYNKPYIITTVNNDNGEVIGNRVAFTYQLGEKIIDILLTDANDEFIEHMIRNLNDYGEFLSYQEFQRFYIPQIAYLN